jgi:hypothetical protein
MNIKIIPLSVNALCLSVAMLYPATLRAQDDGCDVSQTYYCYETDDIVSIKKGDCGASCPMDVKYADCDFPGTQVVALTTEFSGWTDMGFSPTGTEDWGQVEDIESECTEIGGCLVLSDEDKNYFCNCGGTYLNEDSVMCDDE